MKTLGRRRQQSRGFRPLDFAEFNEPYLMQGEFDRLVESKLDEEFA
jgi:hypothetical protein